MPELPEVEVLARQLQALVGATVTDAWARPEPKWASVADARGVITTVRRRGKYLLVTVGEATVVLHLGMTGRLELHPASSSVASSSLSPSGAGDAGEVPGPGAPTHVVAWFALDDGRRLYLCDPRRFGRAVLTTQPEAELAGVGRDPLDPEFDRAGTARRLAGRGRRLKELLLDQTLVSGIGNYLADESLWRAGIHPEARNVSLRRIQRLLDEVVVVMQRSIESGGASMRDYRNLDGKGRAALALECYGRAGLPCRRCWRTLSKGVVGGRGTTWCARCQRR